MTLRRGFTLVEVMIALLIGSVVSVMAYATFAAGLDTQERVTASQQADAAATSMRALLGDALRHATAGDAITPQGMHLDAGSTRLTFVSRGIEPPHGGSAVWRVELAADTGGLVLRAAPRDRRSAPLQLQAPGSTTFAVRFLPLASTEWRDAWNDPGRLPDAIEVRFLDRRGREAMPPLLVRTAPVSGA